MADIIEGERSASQKNQISNSRSEQNIKRGLGFRSQRHSSESLPDLRAISRSNSDQKIWSTVILKKPVIDPLGKTAVYEDISSVDTESLSAKDIAERLFHGTFRPKEVMDFLGRKGQKNTDTLKAYIKLYDFENWLLIDALRVFISTFYLRGEGQMITRILESFSERFYEQNPDIYPSSDCIHLLTTALVMLNTDLHNPQNAGRRMTKSQFVRNTLLGLRDLKIENISESLLEDMYNSIKRNELLLLDDDSAVSSHRKSGVFLRRRDSVKGSVKAMSVNSLNVLSIVSTNVRRQDSLSSRSNVGGQRYKVHMEGYLCRKNVMDNRVKRSSNRTWKNWFVVLRGPEMYFYKPLNLINRMQDQFCTEILNIRHALAENNGSYKGREFVVSLILNNGGLVYLQSNEASSMSAWIDGINYMAALHSSPPPPLRVASLLEEFFYPMDPTCETTLEKSEQVNFITAKLKSYENDFILHSKLLDMSLNHEDDNYVVNEKTRNKMIVNWEKKRDYLNHEIRKYQRYLLALSNLEKPLGSRGVGLTNPIGSGSGVEDSHASS